MAKKVKLSEMTDIWKDVQILSLEDVTIEGDIEIEISGLTRRRHMIGSKA
jgi:acetyl-CoA decarbonylase/synthase, CODH/ACS complex subunit delta